MYAHTHAHTHAHTRTHAVISSVLVLGSSATDIRQRPAYPLASCLRSLRFKGWTTGQLNPLIPSPFYSQVPAISEAFYGLGVDDQPAVVAGLLKVMVQLISLSPYAAERHGPAYLLIPLCC